MRPSLVSYGPFRPRRRLPFSSLPHCAILALRPMPMPLRSSPSFSVCVYVRTTHGPMDRLRNFEPASKSRLQSCLYIECEPPLTRDYYVVTPAIADLLAATPSLLCCVYFRKSESPEVTSKTWPRRTTCGQQTNCPSLLHLPHGIRRPKCWPRHANVPKCPPWSI